jgi:hypothetical protein
MQKMLDISAAMPADANEADAERCRISIVH